MMMMMMIVSGFRTRYIYGFGLASGNYVEQQRLATTKHEAFLESFSFRT